MNGEMDRDSIDTVDYQVDLRTPFSTCILCSVTAFKIILN